MKEVESYDGLCYLLESLLEKKEKKKNIRYFFSVKDKCVFFRDIKSSISLKNNFSNDFHKTQVTKAVDIFKVSAITFHYNYVNRKSS